MKLLLFFALSAALSLSAMASGLPACTLKATAQNELPTDVAVKVVKERNGLFLQFAAAKLPAQQHSFTDQNLIEYIIGYMGERVPRGTKTMEAYEYATSENQVILYVVKSASNKTLRMFLLVDGAGGVCK